MPKHTINWVNDHTEICDRLDERVQLMEDYLDSKPDDFDGIAVKRFLLGQVREQITWYRQSIDALNFVGVSPAGALWKLGKAFWSIISPPTTSAKPSEYVLVRVSIGGLDDFSFLFLNIFKNWCNRCYATLIILVPCLL